MKLKLYDKVIFRVPQFPVDTTLETCWDELKKSIALSSEAFYRYIEHADYKQYNNLPPGIKTTVQKYFNRARFRATPYGTFAGFGLCNVQNPEGSETMKVTIREKPLIHQFIDWGHSDEAEPWPAKPMGSILLFANSTYYRIGENIRYVFRDNPHFDLSDIPFAPLIAEILEMARSPIAVDKVLDHLQSNHHFEENEAFRWICQLVELQLLLTNYHPNIIGEDHFKRTGVIPTGNHRTYTITERQCAGSRIPPEPLERLKELAGVLHGLLPPPPPPAELEDFIRQFLKKYDQRSVPVMEALDPEAGIGYGRMDSPSVASLAMDIADLKQAHPDEPSDNWLKAALLEHCSGHPSFASVPVRLEKGKLKGQPGGLPLPNTFSALFSISDGLIHLEHLGGVTATALAGRFSITGDPMHGYCKGLARIEAEANPDVLFFDIAYTGEQRVDNINRRQNSYGWQLSLLNYDTSEQPLALGDLRLCVRGNELMLFSHRLGKRLVPRLSTAYNHIRSDLPVFRLLCDLQGQGLHTGLATVPQQSVPGLNAYPRIQYHNIVLSPARWKLDLSQAAGKDQSAVWDYVDGLSLPDIIKVGDADQTLLLDLTTGENRQLLYGILKSRKTLWVQEGFKPSHPVIEDTAGNGYNSEFIVAFTHGGNIYKPFHVNTEYHHTPTKRFFLPGSDWLCYELYCHAATADELLIGVLDPLLGRYGGYIASWFFIRYDEGGNHIRFRMRLNDSSHAAAIMSGIGEQLYPYVSDGRLSDVRLRPYTRELERYGGDIMDRVEHHFQLDSRLAMELLKSSGDDRMKYLHCIALMRGAAGVAGFDGTEFDGLVSQACTYHAGEHRLDGTAFKKLNSWYKGVFINGDNSTIMPEAGQPCTGEVLRSYADLLSGIAGTRKAQLFMDLFHMHINRLFPSHQRVHEMIIYEFLRKRLAQERHARSPGRVKATLP